MSDIYLPPRLSQMSRKWASKEKEYLNMETWVDIAAIQVLGC
jgi:hypothetical protein